METKKEQRDKKQEGKEGWVQQERRGSTGGEEQWREGQREVGDNGSRARKVLRQRQGRNKGKARKGWKGRTVGEKNSEQLRWALIPAPMGLPAFSGEHLLLWGGIWEPWLLAGFIVSLHREEGNPEDLAISTFCHSSLVKNPQQTLNSIIPCLFHLLYTSSLSCHLHTPLYDVDLSPCDGVKSCPNTKETGDGIFIH